MAPGQVRVNVKAFGLNRADLSQISGFYPSPNNMVGLEISGVVIETNQCSRLKIGDRICSLVSEGGYSNSLVIDEDLPFFLPEDWSNIDGAGFSECALTAFQVGRYLSGANSVLITAGVSGVGLALLQQNSERDVTVAVSSKEKGECAKRNGAKNYLIYNNDGFISEERYDGAIDLAGGALFESALKLLCQGGRIICLSTSAGSNVKLNLGLVLVKNLQIFGSTLKNKSIAEKVDLRIGLEQKFSLSKLKPLIGKVFQSTDIESALSLLRERKNLGKIICTWE